MSSRPDLKRGDFVDMRFPDSERVVAGEVMDVQWSFDRWQVRLHDRRTVWASPLRFVTFVKRPERKREEKAA